MKTINQLLTERKAFPLKVRFLYLFSALSHGLLGGMMLIFSFLRAGPEPVHSFHYYTADLISLPRSAMPGLERAGGRVKKEKTPEAEPEHQVVSQPPEKKEPENKKQRNEKEEKRRNRTSEDSEKNDADSAGRNRDQSDGSQRGFSISGSGGTQGGGSLGGMDTRFAWYRVTVIDILNTNWIQVADDYARQNRTVIVRFAILKDGTIADLVIEKSSGSAMLDRGVQRAIQASDPLPPVPHGFGKEKLTARFKFIY
jgi:TonB family protein